MNVSDAAIEMLKSIEGSESNMYLDPVGLPTIGVGHLLTKDELSSGRLDSLGVPWYNGLTDDEVSDLLGHDLDSSASAVSSLVSVSLTQNQFDALVSFVFNIGTSAFEKSTLLRNLNAGGYATVPDQMRRWVYSRGKILGGLVTRREKEIALWSGGSA